MSDGYVMIHRSIFNHWTWELDEEEPVTRGRAWIDLIQQACFKDSSKVLVRGKLIEINKGELVASRRFLEERWNWGGTRVRNFLKLLEVDGMIEIKTNQGQTVVTLCNFDKYNNVLPLVEPQANQTRTTGEPGANQGRTKTNKERKVNKEKKESTVPLGTDARPKTETQKMYDVFVLHYQKKYPGETPELAKKDWSALKQILKKIQRRIVKADPDLVHIKQVDFEFALERFGLFLEAVINLNDQWYLDNFTPSILNSKFQELVNKILNQRRNGATSSAKQTILSEETAIRAYEMLMADDRRRTESG